MQTLKHAIVNISYWSTKDTLAQVGRLSFFVCGAVSRLLYTVISRRMEKEQHTSGPPAASSPITTKARDLLLALFWTICVYIALRQPTSVV